ncbi:type II toxin-antitoxin system VapC family toxin [Thermococcus nautili]|uniref:Putative nucleic acid-binding protein, contains PIN domain n=1 Tax=Thermococcus nautili TaxID=195522 RepID=W8NVF4_9EURY|nr:PIN domain-containing protein [Thermococcus nautili]AHL23233.1 putative nucleic acid-binding protein, contains PIN domain [Thermococcus nautili]
MIVLDASLIIDSLLPKLRDRHKLAKELLKAVSEGNIVVTMPRIAKIEMLSVFSRKIGMRAVQVVETLGEGVEFVGEEEFYQVAEAIAPKIQGRAVDTYYIALAFKNSAILLSCDRRQVENARVAGVEAYYVPEEFDKAMKRINELRASP